jgi:MoxR-like ATPase
MKRITGLIGRDELVNQVTVEIKKGKHILLTGPIGIGKSRVLEAAIKRIERRQDELLQAGLESFPSPAHKVPLYGLRNARSVCSR